MADFRDTQALLHQRQAEAAARIEGKRKAVHAQAVRVWGEVMEIDRTNIKAVFDGFGFSKGERIYAMANVEVK